MNRTENYTNTIYIGELPFNITDEEIENLFSPYGNIVLLKVSRLPEESNIKKRPYALISFESETECNNAISALNFYPLTDTELRVMHFNKSIGSSKVPNVWIKNLPEFCTNKMLYETFSVFGTVISCKVARYPDGKTKGYGFVTFSQKIEAKKAIAIGKSLKLDNQKLQVEFYNQRDDVFNKTKKITNLYFKNFNTALSENEIREKFEEIGEIASFCLKMDGEKPKGFGFVSFKNEECNKKGLALNGTDLFNDGHRIYISVALSKEERSEFILNKLKTLDIYKDRKRRNIYITNISVDTTKEELVELFSKYGTVESIRIGEDKYIEDSQWAHILFDNSDSTNNAIKNLNMHEFKGRILSVMFFKGKRERIVEKSKQEDKNQQVIEISDKMRADINDLSLTVASQLKKEIKDAKISYEVYEQIIPEKLLQKSPEEVSEMISMGDVLIKNVKEILKEIKRNKN